jgi:hypothetical protein
MYTSLLKYGSARTGQQIEPFVLPSVASRIVDLQPDPRGGYFALVDVAPAADLGNVGFILQFDAAHNLISSWPFGVFRSVPRGDLFRVSAAAMAVTVKGIFGVGSVSEKPLGPLTAL